MKISYNHLVEHIKENPTIDQLSDSLFQLGHEHEIQNNIFDMEFTPNRGDCLSINGLLRDLAVFYSIEFNPELCIEKLDELVIDFENQSENICPQISFLKLEIDQVPALYKNYLENYFSDLSLNKNNFFTDISNYLSYETGQPTHCYDANKINNKLVFHEIESNEEFETLLDKKISLTGKNAVFSLNNKVINLAGVVGDKSTSCSVNTKSVIVECAFFEPEAIIGKSIKYDIQSEASYKFERGVNRDCQVEVLRRFIKIVSEHANIKAKSLITFNYQNNIQHKIPVNLKKINEIIGINIALDEYINILSKLGLVIDDNTITVPPFRSDLKTENDLAEEVARVIGYDNIRPSKIVIPNNQKTNYKEVENKLRSFLLDNGFYEVINSPFVNIGSDDAIKVDNPLDSNREYLRTNITNSLVENLIYNEKRQKDSIKLFEISDIYSYKNGLNKNRNLSIVASGRAGLNFEDHSIKINKKYLQNLFKEFLPETETKFNIFPRDGLDTKIKNEIIYMEIDIDSIPNEILDYNEISHPPKTFNKYQKISEQPCSYKDISYSIKDFSKVNDVQDLLLNYDSEIIKHIYIFDYFHNENKNEIKIGFRFIFQSLNSTLTNAEIDIVYNDIVNKSLNIKGINIPGI